MSPQEREHPELVQPWTELRGPVWQRRWARVRDIRLPSLAVWVGLAVLLVAAAALIIDQTRGTVFADDEWTWILHRRGGGLGTYLDPHNSHLSLVPVVIYKLLFAAVGIRHYWPYRAVALAGHLAVGTLVFVYVRRRIGDWPALLAAALVLFFGPGWQDFLWPFQVAWLIALGAGVAALLALDRCDRAGDITACVLLLISLASAGPGLAVAVGLVLEVLLTRRRRRWWIVAIPVALYALWWLGYQHTQVSHDSVLYLTRFVFDAAAGVFSSLAGLSGANAVTNSGDFVTWGAPLLAAGLVLLAWRVHRLGRVPVRIMTLSAMALAFWVLTGIGRDYVPLGSTVFTSTGDESRYLYIGAVFILLLAAEGLQGVRIGLVAALAAGVLVAVAVLSNIGSLRDGGAYLRAESAQTMAELGALDLARPLVPANYSSAGFAFSAVQAGSYFAAERALGTPAPNPSALSRLPEGAREDADSQLVTVHHIALTPTAPAPGGSPLHVEAISGGHLSLAGGCALDTAPIFTPTRATNTLDVTIPPAGLVLTARGGPATVALRRFATNFQTLGTLAPGTPALLHISPDLAPQPWHVRLEPSDQLTVCAAG